MSTIELRELGKRFGNRWVFRRVSFTIEPGRFVLLLGANGSGKTVLARHLNGLLLPDEGEVLIDGRPIKADLAACRRTVGMVFQDPESQIIGQTVFEDVAFGPRVQQLSEAEVSERVAEALALTGLEAERQSPPAALSGGRRRRLALAGVIATRSSCIVLDEPFTFLDHAACVELLRYLVRLKERGHTVIMITHDIEKVLGEADRVIALADGGVAADTSPERFLMELPAYGLRRPHGALTELSWREV